MASVSAVLFHHWFSELFVIDTSDGSKYWIWFEQQVVILQATLQPEAHYRLIALSYPYRIMLFLKVARPNYGAPLFYECMQATQDASLQIFLFVSF